MKTTLLLTVLCAALTVTASVKCGTDTCADDEYCDSATTTCQCNLSLYTITENNPSPNVTCDGGKFNIEVSKCWLERNFYNTTSIRLNSTDAICTASREVINGTSWMGIHRPLTNGDCNTIADINTTHVTYRNQLYIYAWTIPYQKRTDVPVNLSCSFPLSINVVLNITLHPIVTVPVTCGTDTCANDEYCDITTTTCQCNPTVYNLTASNPDPNVTCDGGKFNIEVSKCWLEKNGYNTTSISLNSNEANCTASREVINGTSWMGIHRPLTTGDCNTTADVNATHLTYRNQLYIYAEKIPIQTRNDVFMNLFCTYPLTMSVALNVTLHPILGTTEIYGPNLSGSFTVNMIAYKDSAYSTPLTDSDIIYVEDFVYISVSIPSLDTNTFKLKVLSITAFPDNSSTIGYDILQEGCPSPNVPPDQIIPSSNGESNEARFKVKVFQISGSDTVRLSAIVFICTVSCGSTCGSKTISVQSPSNTGTVSINLYATERYYDVSSASGFSIPWTLSSLILSHILVKLL